MPSPCHISEMSTKNAMLLRVADTAALFNKEIQHVRENVKR